MAAMGGGKPPMPGPGGLGGDPGAGKDGAGAGSEEKKQILTTLLEVFKKWDKLESEEGGKKIIADMVALAERYKKEVLKEGGDGAGAPPPGAGDTPPPPSGGDIPGGAPKGKGPDVPA
jgi:hypothetical protein